MPLTYCEITLILTWSENWVISNAAGATTFAVTGKTFKTGKMLRSSSYLITSR